jgi:putative serine/threonine protein kinase
VGIVTEGILDDVPVALKIRRFDADRLTMGNEAKMLRLANSVGIGPRLLGSSRNVLVMELVNGAPLFRWIANSPKQENVRAALDKLLHACFKLDSMGLDHGELSHAPKNVLVTHDRVPCIVDFESASTSRRTANVTSILQYFLFGQVSKLVNASRLFPKKRVILRTLTIYKADQSVENFRNVREALGIA